ncbi:hypothetical protein A2U04_07090 [Fusobacterium necrophorum subsp. funduliforme]|uniref:Uncharacterized protein n=1 Tax=Fusobacterium necrophorum subsp. funduliforme Fnf 1007 TaxID=1161424 RepID=A0AAN3VTX6_9FUSO|nr:hypothetical protein HMPREF1127_0234 [Fusobacterium necrophorum subsp. funduliforme Fnf 1007]KYM47741.1 hypothetical protein A2U04_07090 [Fusobacterium necrophorum subsp. funduliforme]PIM87957.1 hypothetical protein CI112_03780 [Fusobacterium necrophorum subsp. funduliforme]PIM91455.1 hypothetical protein CI113_04220 [Fusobacterium necrophorum subsp. funduliforme]
MNFSDVLLFRIKNRKKGKEWLLYMPIFRRNCCGIFLEFFSRISDYLFFLFFVFCSLFSEYYYFIKRTIKFEIKNNNIFIFRKKEKKKILDK